MNVWDRLREDYEDEQTVLALIDLCEAADRAHARGARTSHARMFELLERYRVALHEAGHAR